MREVAPLLIIGIVAAVWWAASRSRAVFVVRVRAGRPAATRGKVTDAFLAAVADVARDFSLKAGEIRGVPRGREIALRFSPSIPPGARQRLRNWWVISGWPAGPGRG